MNMCRLDAVNGAVNGAVNHAKSHGNQSAPVFSVSGAAGGDGTCAADLNGNFTASKKIHGKLSYGNSAGAVIQWEVSTDLGADNLDEADDGAPKWTASVHNHIRYYNESNCATPPSTGWVAVPAVAIGTIVLTYKAIQ